MKLEINNNFIESIIEVHTNLKNDWKMPIDPMFKIDVSDSEDNPWLHIDSAHHSDGTNIVLGRYDDTVTWLFGDDLHANFDNDDYRSIAEMIVDYVEEREAENG